MIEPTALISRAKDAYIAVEAYLRYLAGLKTRLHPDTEEAHALAFLEEHYRALLEEGSGGVNSLEDAVHRLQLNSRSSSTLM